MDFRGPASNGRGRKAEQREEEGKPSGFANPRKNFIATPLFVVVVS